MLQIYILNICVLECPGQTYLEKICFRNCADLCSECFGVEIYEQLPYWLKQRNKQLCHSSQSKLFKIS
ncbi:unnamed protein product [Paramecium octaurelia]|uniref:Uncharacterized protein n=1 Tax=Paramecium octaurelia TaxID=43137 RepID=A0A8S1Y1R7_PAROT|nr:unnamed protein product [Paramecium octaurelia]